MECPFCTTSLPEDDLFCEACGKPLRPPAQAAGCACGAPAEEIAEDGYCGRCGRLARRPASDHLELVLSADFAGVSDRGLKHQRNEDRFAMQQVGGAYIMVVCDGVSNSNHSELAASSVAQNVAGTLEASLRRHSASSPERTVRTAIQQAQARLAAPDADASTVDASNGDSPSTTVVAALVTRLATALEAAIGWAGDSRAYWIGAGGETRQLTADHSWVNDIVASGTMSLEEAAASPQAHGITRWLGADAGESAQPDVIHFKLPGPGCLLLCTDGLWNYAQKPEELAGLLREGAAIDIARRLVDYANAQGGHDNISAVLLRIGEPAALSELPVEEAASTGSPCQESQTGC